MSQDRDSADNPRAMSEAPAVEDDGEGFVSRWSRRKLGARAQSEHVPAPSQKAPTPGLSESAEAGGAQPDLPFPPPLERLDADSDYSTFFSPKVSEELRRIALRKLFASSKFNLRDGLDDYDDDYRSFESLGDIITADMRHHMARESGQTKISQPSAETEATKTDASGVSPSLESVHHGAAADTAEYERGQRDDDAAASTDSDRAGRGDEVEGRGV